MSDAKAVALAKALHDRATTAVGPLARQMAQDKWPHDMRAIMWRSVAAVAEEMAAKEDQHG